MLVLCIKNQKAFQINFVSTIFIMNATNSLFLGILNKPLIVYCFEFQRAQDDMLLSHLNVDYCTICLIKISETKNVLFCHCIFRYEYCGKILAKFYLSNIKTKNLSFIIIL